MQAEMLKIEKHFERKIEFLLVIHAENFQKNNFC